jgi:hypothetical protein
MESSVGRNFGFHLYGVFNICFLSFLNFCAHRWGSSFLGLHTEKMIWGGHNWWIGPHGGRKKQNKLGQSCAKCWLSWASQESRVSLLSLTLLFNKLFRVVGGWKRSDNNTHSVQLGWSWDWAWQYQGLFCWGSSLPGLHTLDPQLSPPSTLAEFFQRTFLQSHLQTFPPTPFPPRHIGSFGTMGFESFHFC